MLLFIKGFSCLVTLFLAFILHVYHFEIFKTLNISPYAVTPTLYDRTKSVITKLRTTSSEGPLNTEVMDEEIIFALNFEGMRFNNSQAYYSQFLAKNDTNPLNLDDMYNRLAGTAIFNYKQASNLLFKKDSIYDSSMNNSQDKELVLSTCIDFDNFESIFLMHNENSVYIESSMSNKELEKILRECFKFESLRATARNFDYSEELFSVLAFNNIWNIDLESYYKMMYCRNFVGEEELECLTEQEVYLNGFEGVDLKPVVMNNEMSMRLLKMKIFNVYIMNFSAGRSHVNHKACMEGKSRFKLSNRQMVCIVDFILNKVLSFEAENYDLIGRQNFAKMLLICGNDIFRYKILASHFCAIIGRVILKNGLEVEME